MDAALSIATAAIVALVGATWRLGTKNGELASAVEDLSSDVKSISKQVTDHERRIGRVEGSLHRRNSDSP